MEPIDSDMEYMIHPSQRSARPGERVNYLFILPVLGALLMLFFIAAAVFQIDLSNLLDGVMTLLLLVFIVTVVGLFWAFHQKAS